MLVSHFTDFDVTTIRGLELLAKVTLHLYHSATCCEGCRRVDRAQLVKQLLNFIDSEDLEKNEEYFIMHHFGVSAANLFKSGFLKEMMVDVDMAMPREHQVDSFFKQLKETFVTKTFPQN